MSAEYERRYFNVAQYRRMAETGILSEDDRVELIEGEIVERSPIGSRHAACVDRLNKLFNRSAGDGVLVRVQNPIQLDDYSQPQPDVALLRARTDFYEEAHPTAADVLLVVEVSDATLAYDRQIKLPLYARAGIPEVWLVNLPEAKIETYTQAEDGAYVRALIVARGEGVTAHSIPGLTLEVDSILG